ncbi:MAG: hypothetical protein AB7S26_15135 [Sandaracinaceae bacterium]
MGALPDEPVLAAAGSSAARAIPSSRETWFAVLVVAVAYLSVFPYYPQINNPNENARFYMTAAMSERGSYIIDQERARWGWVNDCAVREGHAYSVKAPATSFFGVPAYWAYYTYTQATGRDFDREVALYLCRLTASILPWLLFLFFFHPFLGRHTSSPLVRDAVFYSIALGSCLFGYGILFMSHTLSAAAAFGAFMILHDASRAGRIRTMRAFVAGLLAALVTLLEYPGFAASVVLTVYALFVLRPWQRFLPYSIGGLLPTLAMMHFQWQCFGSPFSPGHLYVESDFFRERHEQGFFGAVGLQWDAVYGLLVHPGAGLFTLTPILILGVIGVIWLLRRPAHRREGMVVLSVVGITLAGIAVMNNWRGGWTIGPRYLVLVYPFLAWAALYGIEPWVRARPRAAAAIAIGALLAGLVLSGIPSAYYPHYPMEVDRPLTQVVSVLVQHDFAPYTWLNRFGVYGELSMLPLLAALVVAFGAAISAARTHRVRMAGLGFGLVIGALWIAPMSLDPAPEDPEVRDAVALIARTWTPAGHDRASQLERRLLAHADRAGYLELAEVYDREGRLREAQRARARAESLGDTADSPAHASAP